jgi:hypothetical protein
MNYSNLAQKTNYVAGSNALELLPFYLTMVNLPGVNLSHLEVGGRDGARLNLTGDTLTYNTLSFEMLVDEDFQIYHEFMDKVLKNVEPETGKFQNEEFDFWIEINNSKGNKLFKVEFYNCRIESIGDIQLDSQDDATEHTMSAEIKYDYYKTIRGTQAVPVISA